MWISRLDWTVTASVTSLWQSCKVKRARPKCCHSLAWKAAALYREDTIAPEVLVAELLVLVLSSSTMVPVALLRPVYTIAPAQARGTQIFPLDSQGFPPSWPDNGAWPRIIIGLFLQPGPACCCPWGVIFFLSGPLRTEGQCQRCLPEPPDSHQQPWAGTSCTGETNMVVVQNIQEEEDNFI